MTVLARMRYISVPNEIGSSYNDNKQYSQCSVFGSGLGSVIGPAIGPAGTSGPQGVL